VESCWSHIGCWHDVTLRLALKIAIDDLTRIRDLTADLAWVAQQVYETSGDVVVTGEALSQETVRNALKGGESGPEPGTTAKRRGDAYAIAVAYPSVFLDKPFPVGGISLTE